MPNPIENKIIILGVTGSIAAYKAVDLASKLHQVGAKVNTILTASALEFITPLSFQSVTGQKAYIDSDLWGREGHITHIGLGRAAELVVIAPASANTLAKLANGIADNLLTVTVLASASPLLIAPAMDAGMFSHPATQSNVDVLKKRGAYFVGPTEGHLASGLVGVGRMVEVIEILGNIRWIFGQNGPLKDKRIIVTAGGTQEPIDPVRFITNRSSGKQGYAIAQAALDRGAQVTLISSPTHIPTPIGCKCICVTTADEMFQAVIAESSNADTLIMSAAVADFRPAHYSGQKIKKNSGLDKLVLEPTMDILMAIKEKRERTGYPRRMIGFAAESQHMLDNARVKLASKGLDLVIANDISSKDAGFEVETNRVVFLFPDGSKQELDLMSKNEVAENIMDRVAKWV